MNHCCSHEVLESALSGNLSAEDESALGRHIEACEVCSSALEQMAGGPGWCREAASLLASDDLDVTAPSSDKWSEIDFTVEHLEPSDDPSALGRLGGYDILSVIGQGGMGIVLKGYDRELKRLVAIKVLAPHLAQSPLARKRFAREAQAAAAVVHPNVLAIHQVQPGGRLPFLVMPLVAGQSLAERLAAQGMLELKEILRIGMQAAAGLAAAHEQGLVHRDVKPANILLEKGIERAVLTDFGLARAADDVTLTRLGVIAGTPQYMSPEQARGEALDGRSDLFSLGCVMYEMATGVSPFKSESMLATMRRLVDDAPQAMEALNPELPPWFVAIVNRLLEKDASRRIGSAKELSELLEGCLAHVQQPTHVPLPIAAPVQPSGCARHAGKFLFWALTNAVRGTCQKPDHTPPAETDEWRPFSGATRAAVTAVLLGIGGIIAFIAGTSEPSDISGQWTGDDWGTVTLKQTASAEYEGTYTDTLGKEAGKIELKWSRIERQYTGDWSEGKSRFGKISVRQAGDEIRGAWTTDRKSQINPGTPGLAPLTWTRPKAQAAAAGPLGWTLTPVISFELRSISNRMGVDALRLEDRRTLSLPRTTMSREELVKWLDANKVNFAVEYLKNIDQWEMKLRNMKIAALPGDQWPIQSASQLAEQFPKLNWNDAASAQAEQKEKGFYSLSIGSGLNTKYAFETSSGQRGVLWFIAQTHGEDTVGEDKSDSILIHYKLLQRADNAAAKRNGAQANAANLRFGPVVERTLSETGRQNPRLLNLENNMTLSPPPTSVKNFDDAMAYARDHDADVIACGDAGGRGLRIIGGLAIQPANWDASPQEVVDAISTLERGLDDYKKTIRGFQDPRETGFSNMWVTADNEPTTFYFKTRGGRIGTLQITRVSDALNGVPYGPVWPKIVARYKLVIDESLGSFEPMIRKQLVTLGSAVANRSLRLNNFLRLDDGHLFNSPPKFEDLSVEERDKWLDETKVNLAIDYHHDTDQWEMKLRNVRFASLPDSDWISLSAKALQEKFLSLKWKESPNTEVELKEKGFYSLIFTKGVPPPMTFAYETSDGKRGVFQFSGYAHQGAFGDTADIRYKQIQQAGAAHGGAAASPPESAAKQAESKWRFVEKRADLNRAGIGLDKVLLRLQDGVVLSAPNGFTFLKEADGSMPHKEQLKWLNEKGANLAFDYDPASREFELKLRRLQYCEISHDDFTNLSADQFPKRLDNYHWMSTFDGFYSWKFLDPVPFAFKTPEGRYGMCGLTSKTDATTEIAGERVKNITRLRLRILLLEDASKPEAEDSGARGDAGSVPSAKQDDSSESRQSEEPLADAIAKFNTSAAESPNGKDQPPLTEDELIAALRWKIETEKDGKLSKGQFDELRSIIQKQTLPAGARFHLVTTLDGVDSERFNAWVIDLRLPETDGKESVHLIRRQLISQIDQAGKPIPLGPAAKGDDNSTPLAAAISGFNGSNYTIHGVRQQPLTEEEVVAAIRWWKSKRDEVSVTNGEFAALQKIADSRQLPEGTQFELISGFQPADLKNFYIWSVRIRMPYKSGHGGTYAYTIRNQYVRSEIIDEAEIAWGAAAASGLQAGVRLDPRNFKYVSGQQVTPIFYYRNTGQQELATSFPRLMTRGYYKKIAAVDSFAKEIALEQDQNPAFPVGWLMLPLPPGGQHEIRGLPILLDNGERGSAETVIRASPGQTVRLRFELPDVQKQDAPALPTGETVFFLGKPPEETGNNETAVESQ